VRIAFVGVKRKYMELAEDYRLAFNRFHLELPYYFARDGGNEVTITTVDYRAVGVPVGSGVLRCVTETEFKNDQSKYDVIVHWRKWFPEFYKSKAVNVINCQDHSFSGEWVAAVRNAYDEKKLTGILCFPTWHQRNLQAETGLPDEALIPGLTLGVDTEIYRPEQTRESTFQMLWASDPGRGLDRCIQLALELYRRNPQFKLNVCYPDYVPPRPRIQHPAVIWHGNVSNGPKLWKLFNTCTFLPYTSCFMEPSSRAHRQGQASGMVVLYPPGRGTPSELIRENGGGYCAPIDTWADIIQEQAEGICMFNNPSGIMGRARELALSENWAVQAKRFNDYFGGKRQ
jgi:hypothetical protein